MNILTIRVQTAKHRKHANLLQSVSFNRTKYYGETLDESVK